MTTTTTDLKASIRYAVEDLLRAEGCESVSIQMGDRVILAGPRAELGRMLGYSEPGIVQIPLIREGDKLRASAPAAAPALPAAEQPADEPERLDSEQSREYLIQFLRDHSTEKQFYRSILGTREVMNMPGDLARELARALRMRPAAAPAPESQPAAPMELIGYVDPAELADFEESAADDAAVILWHTEFPGARRVFVEPAMEAPSHE